MSRFGLDDQLRSETIGASETPALMGLSRFQNALDVFRRKVGLDPRDPNDAPNFGHLIEEDVAQWYADFTGKTLTPGSSTRHHDPARYYVSATVDYLVQAEGIYSIDEDALSTASPIRRVKIKRQKNTAEAIVEIKGVGMTMQADWGLQGTSEVPIYVAPQVAVQMSVMDIDRAVVLAVFEKRGMAKLDWPPRIYYLERDLEFEQMILDEIERFYFENWVPGIPPEIIGPDLADVRWPENVRQEKIRATPEADKIWASIRRLHYTIKALEEEKEELTTALKLEHIRDASGIVFSNGDAASWKLGRESVKTAWKAIALALRPEPMLIEKHTTRTPAKRKFFPTFKQQKEKR